MAAGIDPVLMADLFKQYTLDLSEAVAMLVAAVARDLPDPGAVFQRIEDMAIEPELGENPVAKHLMFNVAKLLRGYGPAASDRSPG